MNNIQMLIWLFPSIFIFHDFEEIIFKQAWVRKNKYYLTYKLPSLIKRILPHLENITTSSFAFGVAEEFILINIITYVSYIMNWYNLWIGLFVAFTLHLLMHCFQTLIIRRYIPAVVTSVICLPLCIYIINQVTRLYSINTIVLYSIFGLIILIINWLYTYNPHFHKNLTGGSQSDFLYILIHLSH
jgi:hypothetical protein